MFLCNILLPYCLSSTNIISYSLSLSLFLSFPFHLPSSVAIVIAGCGIVYQSQRTTNTFFFVSETRNRITTPSSLKPLFRAHKGMEAIRPVDGQRQNDNFLSNSENSLVNDLPPPPEPFPLHLLSKNASSSADSRVESDQIVSAWRSLEMI